jgi:endo-1,4-beta-xylanase
LAHPACTAITIWGIADRDSWLNQLTNSCVDGGSPVPLLWDDNYEKKPAYEGVMDALLGR